MLTRGAVRPTPASQAPLRDHYISGERVAANRIFAVEQTDRFTRAVVQALTPPRGRRGMPASFVRVLRNGQKT